MKHIVHRSFRGLVAISLLCCLGADEKRSHLDWAKVLVKEIEPQFNVYGTRPSYIRWKGQGGAERYENRTNCSGFMMMLMQQTYGFSDEDCHKWLSRANPTAANFHDAIMEGRRFKRIEKIGDIRPGDVMALKYPPGGHGTGHVMLIAEAPRQHEATAQRVEGTTQWEVAIIDSTSSPHGVGDTRRKSDGTVGTGVGQGFFRLYGDATGKIVGYSWTMSKGSQYYGTDQRHLAVGRLEIPAKSE